MIEGAQLNRTKIKENIEKSVMMVTALSPIIGYDQASVISHYAIDNDLTLKEAALKNGVSEELFDRVVVPINMTHPDGARKSGAKKSAAKKSSAKKSTAKKAGAKKSAAKKSTKRTASRRSS